MTPRLSIVIPAYNIEAYIAEAIGSALAQTLEETEVIVVDDGSTDRTGSIARGFSDRRLRIVSKSNGGLSSARNAGIREARAPFIGFLDGDDRWLPDKGRRHLEIMEADPGVALTFCHSAYIDEAGLETGRLLITGPTRPSLRQMVLRNVVANGSTPVVRASCFETAGCFDESLKSCEDWEMWVRILRETKLEAALVPEVLTAYRINTRSLSFNFDQFLEAARAAAARIGRETPQVPAACVRRGLAMCFRIAGSKALKMGDRARALALIGRALRMSPELIMTDPRLLGSLASMAAPRELVDLGHRLLEWRAGLRRPQSGVR